MKILVDLTNLEEATGPSTTYYAGCFTVGTVEFGVDGETDLDSWNWSDTVADQIQKQAGLTDEQFEDQGPTPYGDDLHDLVSAEMSPGSKYEVEVVDGKVIVHGGDGGTP